MSDRPNSLDPCAEKKGVWALLSSPSTMSLPDFTNDDVLAKLEEFLGTKSYLDGYVYT